MAQKAIGPGTRGNADFFDGAYAGGIIASHRRATNKAFDTTETGYIRLDDVPLLGGRSYLVIADSLRVAIAGTRTVNDHVKFTIRQNNSGVATTASTEIGRAENSTGTGSGSNDTVPNVIAVLNPASDLNASFLLSAVEVPSTTATYAVQSDTGNIGLTVYDMGLQGVDTGTDV